MDPFFSVIIPTYNQDSFLIKCLDSLEKQTFNDFETIIIDNFSKDNTEKISLSYSKYKIYKKFNNDGIIGKSRNIGTKLSRGKWLAFLDTDDLWTQNKLEDVYNEINKLDFDVFCNSEWIISEKKNLRDLWIYGHYGKSNIYKKMLTFGNCFSTSASIIKKKFLIEKNIYFNEDKKFVTAEDYDFFLNIVNNKGKVCFYNKPLGYHTFHEASASANREKHLKHIIEVKKQHIFHVQKFTKNKKKLWKNMEKILFMQENIINFKKNSKKFFFVIFMSFIYNPLNFVQIIYFFFKKYFLQKIYFLKYK